LSQLSIAVGTAADSLEEPTLNVGDFDACGTIRIIIHHAVDPRAHRIATHQPGIAWLQQFGRRGHIRHAGTEPQIVGIWIEEYV